ncbi:kinase-like domain-containing protein [Mycena filopes]|nr:kinase-like domain-containing protein [Mycena filopes]
MIVWVQCDVPLSLALVLILGPSEQFWTNHQPWLERCGYKLRPRYSPGWVPSWSNAIEERSNFEDGHQMPYGHVVLDAVWISDGVFVVLKKIRPSKHPDEVNICSMLAAGYLGSDPHNHCVPVYEVLCVPDDEDMVLMVMPFLSNWLFPEFHTVAEVVDFGLQFIHRQNIAHRDCKVNNILMDSGPLYPEPRHPVVDWMKRDWSGESCPTTRTKQPVKYYIVDFGLSRHYPPDQPRPLDPPYFGGDQSVPEYRSGAPCDSFAVDVYCLGNVFREQLTHAERAWFLKPLVEEMVQNDPKLRPTIDQVAEKFDRLRSGLHWWTLRARAAERGEDLTRWTRRVGYSSVRS